MLTSIFGLDNKSCVASKKLSAAKCNGALLNYFTLNSINWILSLKYRKCNKKKSLYS